MLATCSLNLRNQFVLIYLIFKFNFDFYFTFVVFIIGNMIFFFSARKMTKNAYTIGKNSKKNYKISVFLAYLLIIVDIKNLFITSELILE